MSNSKQKLHQSFFLFLLLIQNSFLLGKNTRPLENSQAKEKPKADVFLQLPKKNSQPKSLHRGFFDIFKEKTHGLFLNIKAKIKALLKIRPAARTSFLSGSDKGPLFKIPSPKIFTRKAKSGRNQPDNKHQNEDKLSSNSFDELSAKNALGKISQADNNLQKSQFQKKIQSVKNAIQMPKPKQKKFAGRSKNLIFEKYGISSEFGIRESMTYEEQHPTLIRTRKQAKMASMDPEELSSPISIVWETGLIKQSLEAQGKGAQYLFLRQLIAKATSILRAYVRISKNQQDWVKIKKGKNCGFLFKKSFTTDAHLVMLARLFTPGQKNKSTIARSIYCSKNRSNRAIVGVLEINGQRLLAEGSSLTRQRNFLMTLVHETLHTLAFHEDSEALFDGRPVKSELQNLSVIKRFNPAIFDKGHWAEWFIPGDLMIPFSKSNSLVSIYTLELLEHQSDSYFGQRKSLVGNDLYLDLKAQEAALAQKCGENERPKGDAFCSEQQMKNDHRLCSKDYVFQTFCQTEKLENNCYIKSPLVEGNCMDPVLEDNYQVFPFEHRGTNSRCFVDQKEENSYCLKYEVVEGKVSVLLGNESFVCKGDGQIIKAKYKLNEKQAYNLQVKCPVLSDFVKQHSKTSCPENCNQNGFCSNGKCVCFYGFDEKTNCKDRIVHGEESAMFSEILSA